MFPRVIYKIANKVRPVLGNAEGVTWDDPVELSLVLSENFSIKRGGPLHGLGIPEV